MNPLIDRMRRQQTEQIALQGLPFLTGRILKDQVFFPGVLHAIEHGLRRSTQGWMPLRLRGGPAVLIEKSTDCLLYTSPSPRDRTRSRMPSSA